MSDCPTCGGAGFLESPSGKMYDCPECAANAHEVTICTNCGNGYHGLSCPYCDDEEYGPTTDDDSCPYCKGTGVVTPTSAHHPGQLVLNSTSCDACDGTGRI